MSSRSSSSEPEGLLLGRVTGRRGTTGELTVRVFSGDSEPWAGLARVRIGQGASAGRYYPVEASRAYRDRLVLKLEGIDDPGAAEALRGAEVVVAHAELPELGKGEYYTGLLVGSTVFDESAGPLGQVRDVMSTGGTDLLVVAPEGSVETEEVMIPMATGILLEVNEAERRIRVRLPEGLLELNRSGDESAP